MKNKIWFLLIFVLFFTGCGNYRELNDMAVVTGVSIDKKGDEFEVGFLIANSPKVQTSSKEGEAQTTVYSAKGKTIFEAASHIDYKSPKKLYFGHINVVIISESVGKNGFFDISDYFLRNFESRKRFFLMQSKDEKAKNILKIISPLESFPSQSIATLLESNKDAQSVVETVDYSTFISRILEKGYDPILPVITISGNTKKGEKSKNVESTEPDGYLRLDSAAIYRNDEFVGYESFKHSQAVSIINNNVSEFKTIFKHKNHKIGFSSDILKSKIIIKNPSKINVLITGKGNITEINYKENLNNPKVIKKLEKSLNKSITKTINETIFLMKFKYQADVFGFGNKIYKKYPDKWKKVEKKWNEKYFQKLKINVKTDVTINSSGSLDKTIREVKNEKY